MKKILLAGTSILAVVLIILGSHTNLVGYQIVQTSQQNLIKERINQKDLLFQTICDLANNRKIQNAIHESQGGKLFSSVMNTPLTVFPAITKKQLNFMYILGVLLSKTMSKARIASFAKEHSIMNIHTKEKMDSIIGNSTKLSKEMTQLSLLSCHCCAINSFPDIICNVLEGLTYVSIFIGMVIPIIGIIGWFVAIICLVIAIALQCSWFPYGLTTFQSFLMVDRG